MTRWLASLPHQIPFRAASAGQRQDAKTIEGTFLCTANDETTAEVMLVEAMAQLAGGLALQPGSAGMLTGIEHCQVDRPIVAGDRVHIQVTLEASFGGTHRFAAVATLAGLECARGRFYLAAANGAAS